MVFRRQGRHAVTPQNRGRFPSFDVLDQVGVWDEVTAGVVLARLSPPRTPSFFTTIEIGIVEPLLDLLLAQDCEPRVPVVALLDERLARGESDGWHYDDLPADGQAWRDSLSWLDDDAQAAHGHGFAELSPNARAGLVQQISDAATSGGTWHSVPAARIWSLWTRYACTGFYSHPWAWNEIGFSGPAYPRGYANSGIDARESWEVADHDASDPVSFAERIERARRADLDLRSPAGPQS